MMVEEHPAAAARAAALAPLLEAAGAEIEATRRLPARVLEALHAAGMFRLLLPRELGGEELAPESFVAAMEALAEADASAAWCVCQSDVSSIAAAWLDPEAARRVFGPRDAALAWGLPDREARAVAVEGGGYRLSGTWSFASGGHHATWLGAHCAIVEADGSPRTGPGGRPAERTLLFPREAARMDEVWDVLGLRGTGSDAYSVADLFVPEAHSFRRDDPTGRRHPGALYRFTTSSLYAAGFGGVALGIARRALDAFLALARDKTPRGLSATLRESAVVQMQTAQCEASLQAARAFLTDTLRRAQAAAAARDGGIGLDRRMAIRLAATHAIQQAAGVVDTVFAAAGTGAISAASPFERRFGDIHSAAQHQQGRLAHYETVGKYLLGLGATGPFV
jgi:alkylation response protein AidB-like acyl-CoA dehydrogenase